MERRGRIPVAKFRTQEAKTRSRSRVREPDYNEQDPEHDMFTLLEDNIALKEENKELKLQIEAHKTTQGELQTQHDKLNAEFNALQQRQNGFEAQLKELNTKFTKTNNERNALDKLHKMKVDQIHNLTSELEHMREQQQAKQTANATNAASAAAPTASMLLGSVELKRNLLKILQHDGSSTGPDSLIDVDANAGVHITSALVERLVDEFLSLKQSTNSVELQLYEANEKMAELLEQQHHLDEENETLRTENTNLTKVAKLLTENMKESVETSQKMEAALIKLKQRNEELMSKMRPGDLTDGQQTPSSPSNVELEQIKEQVQQQTRDHNERIVEMQTLMDAAIAKTTNDELKKLQLKLEILEEELRQALSRASKAEQELAVYQQQQEEETEPSAPAPPPPPPPPPLPTKLLYSAAPAAASTSATASDSLGAHIAAHHLHSGQSGADKIIGNVKQQVQAEAATGLDALVREFKSGRVTLRRNRRKTSTNEALQEMFQVLEISQKQNRNSKICVNMHI